MKVMAVLSVSLSKNIDKRMEKEYTLIDKVFFDLTVMSTDQEEKKEAIRMLKLGRNPWREQYEVIMQGIKNQYNE